MKFIMEILSLQTHGDSLEIVTQGKSKREADWQPYKKFVLNVPTHTQRHYRIGDIIQVEITKKP
jgi:hypothetical protein